MPEQSPPDDTGSVPSIAADPAISSKYEFLEVLGSGGMGLVYKARERSSNRAVAIKTLRPTLDSASSGATRFQVEWRLLSKLRHPNIVTLLDFGATSDSTPYMVLELIEGRTLAAILSEEGQIETERVLNISLQVSDALAHAHAQKILHRDIKPSNLMLKPEANNTEHVYVTDFGIGKAISESGAVSQKLTHTGELIGTPTYMSPEQSKGNKIDERSDLYSLGCVMYEAFTGSPPFISSSLLGTVIQHQRETPLSIPEASMGRSVDPRLEAIVKRLLEKDAGLRFQSAADLGKALTQLRLSAETAKLPVTASTKEKKSTGKESELTDQPANQLGVNPASRSLLRQVTSMAIPIGLAIAVASALIVGKSHSPARHVVPEKTASPAHGTAAVEGTSSAVPDDSLKGLIAKTIADGSPDFLFASDPFQATDKDLPAMRAASCARTVRLSGYEITDAGLDNLIALPLTSLSLSRTGARDLHALRNMVSLVFLDLKHTRLKPEAFAVLPHLQNLEFLSLEDTGVREQDLPQLKALTKLKTLSLKNNKLNLQAVEKLQKQLPGCSILREAGAPGGTGIKAGTFNRLVAEGDQWRDKRQFSAALWKYKEAENVAPYDSSVTKPQLIARLLADADLAWVTRQKTAASNQSQKRLQKQLLEYALASLKTAERSLNESADASGLAEVYAREAQVSRELQMFEETFNYAQDAARLFDAADQAQQIDNAEWQLRRMNNLELLAESCQNRNDIVGAKAAYERLKPLASRFNNYAQLNNLGKGNAQWSVRQTQQAASGKE